MKYIDNFLNGITMYKLVLYGLLVLSVLSVMFGFVGLLPYNGWSLLSSAITLFIACFVINIAFARLFNVQENVESSYITGLILFFLLFPLNSLVDLKIFILVSLLAMASKYLLVVNKKHIFNPVAISTFIIGLFGSGAVAWWVGSTVMLIPVSILGFLILRKTQRFQMFFMFVLFSILSVSLFAFLHHINILSTIITSFISGPIIFLGTIMLTEPLTTPPDKKNKIIYGGLVGALFGAQFNIGPLFSTPELALLIGNAYSFFVSPRIRLVLTLIEKKKLSKDIYEFIWKLDRKISFKAGQYLEWTLGHSKADLRGNRRFFTISSSPTENDLKLGIKFYENSSSFKKKLLSLEPGEKMTASQLAGDFVLTKDISKKIVFIAGGIGVTPFRSMIKEMLDKGEKRDIVLFFSNRTSEDIVYKDIFDNVKDLGVRTIYVVNKLLGPEQKSDVREGFINSEMITSEVPDYKERYFYISGPRVMVTSFEDTLNKLGVKRSNIHTDFFPGFV
ncbi:oxidoreductase [Patescibacteria group bacterium]|nr:oxidoreductase [Patescibacteria group bacterium]